jgi:release factor glutamine methyltransferase
LKEKATWKKLVKRLLETFYRPLVVRYLRKDRTYRHDGIHLLVRKGVFHPGLFLSTKTMFKYLENLDLRSKRFLELGCGTGLISIGAARRGAVVTAVDISGTAVDNLIENADRNRVTVEAIKSDLFARVAKQRFDVIVITPPYYPRNPRSESEYAWYCGENFEYFAHLFAQLPGFTDSASEILMILSEDCQLDDILQRAAQQGWAWDIAYEGRALWEKQYIFRFHYR